MIVYSIMLFLIAILIFAMGVLVYRGNTRLIHDYHQTKIKESEQQEYGRAFAKGMFSACVTFLISGIIALFGKRGSVTAISCLVLAAGLIVSLVILIKVQKKYNGGLF